jgi:hypothetical protein
MHASYIPQSLQLHSFIPHDNNLLQCLPATHNAKAIHQMNTPSPSEKGENATILLCVGLLLLLLQWMQRRGRRPLSRSTLAL